jgi:hypothetical protein
MSFVLRGLGSPLSPLGRGGKTVSGAGERLTGILSPDRGPGKGPGREEVQ